MTRVLVAGATGAIGRPLVAALNAHGHAVAGLTRDPNSADLLSRLGAQPLVADVLDRDATAAAVLDARPDVVVEQLTALPRSYIESDMSPARSTSATTRPSRSASGCPPSPGSWARRRRGACRPGRTWTRTRASTPSCFEGPTTTLPARSSASIPDRCHGTETRAVTTCASATAGWKDTSACSAS
ncbi:SDR family oxidoreductase [Sorangium sp. So ce233]|uniref:SDR family oxidoreductase n=1 Tax=Sorangium sp. So ce233 TaxID=3133290 RepID=UPI003F611A0F